MGPGRARRAATNQESLSSVKIRASERPEPVSVMIIMHRTHARSGLQPNAVDRDLVAVTGVTVTLRRRYLQD